jgi:MarR family transcriptional regulator, organic hydroperoxide resistance regulator
MSVAPPSSLGAGEPAGPPAEEALTTLARSFKGAMGAVRRLRGRETRHLGKLSYAQYHLLFGLEAEPELSGSQLACMADLAPATVAEMLDHLEADGLVQRARSERDKRVVLTSLTKRGRMLVEQRRASFEVRWNAALAEFDPEQLTSAAAVLDRLTQMFDEFED